MTAPLTPEELDPTRFTDWVGEDSIEINVAPFPPEEEEAEEEETP